MIFDNFEIHRYSKAVRLAINIIEFDLSLLNTPPNNSFFFNFAYFRYINAQLSNPELIRERGEVRAEEHVRKPCSDNVRDRQGIELNESTVATH